MMTTTPISPGVRYNRLDEDSSSDYSSAIIRNFRDDPPHFGLINPRDFNVSDDNSAFESLRTRFNALADEWERETAPMSSVSDIVGHHAYQQILTMGNGVIPLILQDLRDSHRQWFYALRLLTGENPVRPDDVGYISRMVDAWVKWGQSRRYIDGVTLNVFTSLAS